MTTMTHNIGTFLQKYTPDLGVSPGSFLAIDNCQLKHSEFLPNLLLTLCQKKSIPFRPKIRKRNRLRPRLRIQNNDFEHDSYLLLQNILVTLK
jgi:hypothetical protein